jgi:hypothetical protein
LELAVIEQRSEIVTGSRDLTILRDLCSAATTAHNRQGSSLVLFAEHGEEGLGIPAVFASSCGEIIDLAAAEPVDHQISHSRQHLRSRTFRTRQRSCYRLRPSSSLVGRRPRLLVTHPVDSVLDSPVTAIPIPQRQGIRPIASNTRDCIRHSSTMPCAGSHFANPAESCTDNRRQHGVKSMALSPTPARVGDLFECNKQAPRIGGWHWSVLPCFVRTVPQSVKTTENSGRISNADDQRKFNAKL